MLRPSASAAKVSALAAESMSASLRWAIGNRIAAPARQAIAMRSQVWRWIRASGPLRRSQVKVSPTVIAAKSGACCGSAAEPSARHKDQYQQQDREDDHIGPAGREEMAAKALDEADQDAADHRAGDAADAAQDRGAEGAQPRRVADDEAREVVVEAEDQRRRAGQGRAEKERGDDDAVDIDAHHACRLGILRRRPHRLAEPGPVDEAMEAHHQEQ